MLNYSLSFFSVSLILLFLLVMIGVSIFFWKKSKLTSLGIPIAFVIALILYTYLRPAYVMPKFTPEEYRALILNREAESSVEKIEGFLADGYFTTDEFRISKLLITGCSLVDDINRFVHLADSTKLKTNQDFTVLEALVTFRRHLFGLPIDEYLSIALKRNWVREKLGLQADEVQTPQFKSALLTALLTAPNLTYSSAQKVTEAIEKTTPESAPLIFLYIFENDLVYNMSNDSFVFLGDKLDGKNNLPRFNSKFSEDLSRLRSKYLRLNEVKNRVYTDTTKSKLTLPQ
ncbi:MAG: hypothetical protein SFU91_00480 [Chloroherpetonaceae bacterium]|nr:hypothetical protein [Chloroherpetonaceae bacterium]